MGAYTITLITLAVFTVTADMQESSDDCLGVTRGLSSILGPCRTSVRDCLSKFNFTLFSTICLEPARQQYELFQKCQGQTFANQVFGSLCSGTNCPSGPFSEECIARDTRCYQVAPKYNGQDAYDSCQCNSDTLTLDNITSSQCPDACASGLTKLASDLGCCVNTAIHVLFFSTCGSQAENPDDNALDRLFTSCNVTLPDPCYHPFQDPPRSGSSVTMFVSSVSTAVLLTATTFIVSLTRIV